MCRKCLKILVFHLSPREKHDSQGAIYALNCGCGVSQVQCALAVLCLMGPGVVSSLSSRAWAQFTRTRPQCCLRKWEKLGILMVLQFLGVFRNFFSSATHLVVLSTNTHTHSGKSFEMCLATRGNTFSKGPSNAVCNV